MHWDETCRRLRDWSDGSAQAEALSRQVILASGYTDVDPTHPRGGPDGQKDALCRLGTELWIMASYFPRGQKNAKQIKGKFLNDFAGVQRNKADGIAFVTNQEVPESLRRALQGHAALKAEIFHLDRVATVLDQPSMAEVRRQFLGIEDVRPIQVAMGGQGGRAPGAGGGGGGAIGSGARAGDGGPGGRILDAGNIDIEALLAPILDGEFPGGGGGGAPASGANSLAGSGGAGGDRIRTFLDGEMLRRLGITRFAVRVGDGGKNGSDGQPTGYDLIDDRDNIIISVNAPAGRSGSTQWTLPWVPLTVMPGQESQTHVQAAFLANSVEMREGLFSVLSGGWCSYTCKTFPAELQWPLVMQIALGSVRLGGQIKIDVTLICPDGTEATLEAVEVLRSETDSNPCWTGVLALRPTVSMPGRWIVSIRSPGRELAQVPIEVRQLK